MADRNFDATSKLTQKLMRLENMETPKLSFCQVVWKGSISLNLC